MKKAPHLFVLFFLLLISPSFKATAAENAPYMQAPQDSVDNEIAALDALIDATTTNLANQKIVRSQLEAYLQLHNQYLQNTDDKQLAFRMIKSAQHLLLLIKDNNLRQVFEADFISELTLFSNIAAKRTVLRP